MPNLVESNQGAYCCVSVLISVHRRGILYGVKRSTGSDSQKDAMQPRADRQVFSPFSRNY